MEEQFSNTEAVASELAEGLSAAVTSFALGERGARTAKNWTKLMQSVVGPELVKVVLAYNDELESRGLPRLSEERAKILVKAALADTQDLRKRLLSAPGSITAAGRFSLGKLVGRTHQMGILSSLIRLLTGQAAEFSAGSSPEYTGRKRWRVADPSVSRHSHLDFAVDTLGVFFVEPGVAFAYPREDIQNASASSNCRCWLEYEIINSQGFPEWR